MAGIYETGGCERDHIGAPCSAAAHSRECAGGGSCDRSRGKIMRMPRIGLRLLLLLLGLCAPMLAQTSNSLESLTEPHDYAQKRASSYDTTGGNADFRTIEPGATLTLLDAAGPG